MPGMTSGFYKEVSEMVGEAIERLDVYLHSSSDEDASGVFKSIRDAGYAFLEGENLKARIREDVGIRFERDLTNAAITARSINTLTKAPTNFNAPVSNALRLLQDQANRLAIEAERRETSTPEQVDSASHSSHPFISERHIHALKNLPAPGLDPTRLIRLIEETNLSFTNGCFMATAMLIRAITDHIPPVFGVQSFAQISNSSTADSRSFKQSMDHLDKSLRKIADSHLHLHIRPRESLPQVQQVVGFQGDVDVLLSEVIRRL